MHKHRFILFFLLLWFIPLSQASSLSSPEKEITTYIAQHQAEQLSLLEALVNINSGTQNISGVKRVGKKLQKQFDQLGFKTRWVEEPPTMHRAPTLMASHDGTKGKRLLLIGHLDTVFSSDSPFQTYRRLGDKAMGPGVVDDKGGDVVILYALKALQASHSLDDMRITVVLTGDEEESGKPASISRKPLFEAASRSDIALDFECANTSDTASISRRGISNWIIEAQGLDGHSSTIFQPSIGYGANFELIRILNTMRTELSSEQYITLNPGLLMGGTRLSYERDDSGGRVFGNENVIAHKAIATGDLRYISQDQKQVIEKKIVAIVNQHLPKTSAFVHFTDGIPAMSPTEKNLALLEQYSEASRDLGYGAIKPLDPIVRGAGDISFIASMVSANLVGLGPLGTDTHSVKETLDIPALTIQTQRAALLMYRLSQ
jgi:glutamate carboxypeptidase